MPWHEVLYTSPLQMAQHQEVLDHIWNGIVSEAEIKSIHAALSVDPSVCYCVLVLLVFSKKIFHIFKKKNTQVNSLQKHKKYHALL
jgi:hypothetical protein